MSRFTPPRSRVVCIGGANVDRKLRSIGRLRYGTSNPAVAVHASGGVARNVAENLALLGIPVSLWAMVGDDAEADALMRECIAAGIDVSLVKRIAGERTGTYTAVLDDSGELVVALADMAVNERFTPAVFAAHRDALTGTDWVVVDTNVPAATLAALLQDARLAPYRLCVVTVSSPKARRLPTDLRGVDVLVCNRDEAAALTGVASTDEVGVHELGKTLIAKGCLQVVVTDGAAGVTWCASDGSTGCVSAPSVEVLDVTGAGDAFAAGVLYSLARRGDDLARACETGVKLAAHTVQSPGTVMERQKFLELKAELDRLYER